MISYLAKMVFFRLMSWRIEGDFPQLKKFIVAVYPHTRNMDFIVGVLTRAVLNEKISYVGKQELFNPLTGWFFRALGGTPINRNSNENNVSAIAQIFKEKDAFRMAIAPEGTRKKVDRWKTGFYYIASGGRSSPFYWFTLTTPPKRCLF
jgi:1-acyl-sn-glycerol-3-phosphate acyltransferase